MLPPSPGPLRSPLLARLTIPHSTPSWITTRTSSVRDLVAHFLAPPDPPPDALSKGSLYSLDMGTMKFANTSHQQCSRSLDRVQCLWEAVSGYWNPRNGEDHVTISRLYDRRRIFPPLKAGLRCRGVEVGKPTPVLLSAKELPK
jgi:hypothetical protein